MRLSWLKPSVNEQAVFGLYSLGVNTARDEWVYDFDDRTLRDKVLFFAVHLQRTPGQLEQIDTPRGHQMERGTSNAQSFQDAVTESFDKGS